MVKKLPPKKRGWPSLKIFTVGNPKIVLGLGEYLPVVLMISPADRGGYEVCYHASAGCRAACLNNAGMGGIVPGGLPTDPMQTTNKIQAKRLERKRLFFEERRTFWDLIERDIDTLLEFADQYRLKEFIDKKPVFRRRVSPEPAMRLCLRLNGTSDIPWEKVKVPGADNIMVKYPSIQFYDYTKIPGRFKLPKNYHLTYSRSEKPSCRAESEAYYKHGVNTAVVFDDLFGYPEFWGKPVFNGKATDLRFLDPFPCVVGLSELGSYARRDRSGFVVRRGARVNPRRIEDEGGDLFPDIP